MKESLRNALIYSPCHARKIIQDGVEKHVAWWSKVVGKEMTHKIEDQGGPVLTIYPKDNEGTATQNKV